MSGQTAGLREALRGCRISLRAEEGEYQGTVHAVNEREGSVTLVGVKFRCGERDERLRGVQKFMSGDVRAITILDTADPGDPPAAAVPAAVPGRDRMVMDKQSRDRPILYSQNLVDDSLLLAHVALEDSDDSSEARNGEPIERTPSPPPLLSRPHRYVVIDSEGRELTDAASYLLTQGTVGLAAEGVLLGRSGQLSLLSLATADVLFVVDILELGTTAVEALRPILESSSVQKVIHDCRGLSDLLAHNYNVLLENVFDTQAAEAYLYHKQHGAVPSFVSNVAHTLVTRLHLLPRQVFFPRYRLEKMREDQEVWLRRPLSEPVLEAAVKNVVYLRELRQVQMDLMFRPFVDCVNVYLSSVRDGDDEDADASPYDSHRCPVGIQTVLEAPPRPSRVRPDREDPRSDNNVLLNLDQGIQFTRNVWKSSGRQ